MKHFLQEGVFEQSTLLKNARLPVSAACVVLALACNYILGKDMAWDTLNYHLYAGFSALNDRFGQDYFAAGPLAYFNPFAYVPFYLMVSAGLPALTIGCIFAAVHSIILWLTYELGVSVCASSDDRVRVFGGACAAVLAFMNPIMMQEIGSCFADITTAELTVGGWVLLAGAVRTPRISRVIWAGLLLGSASSLKLSNALHAVSAFAIFLMLPLAWKDRIRYGFFYGVALGIGFVIVAAPWSYRLWQMFRNPMFPLFNRLFRSPEFSVEPMHHYRFIPESFADALWRPFVMIDPSQMRHEELSAPDLRYAVLMLLLVLLVSRWIWQHFVRKPAQDALPLTTSARVLAALGLGLALDWILWLQGSGNSRYFLAMACIAAVVVVGLLFQLFARQPKIRNYILVAIFGVQTIQLYMGTEYRWNGVPWGGQWFDVAVPDRLKTEPNLYLTMGTQSNSFIAPFLAKSSGLINFSGGYVLSPDGANGARIKALIRRFSPHVRVLTRGAKLYEDAERRVPRRSEVDGALQDLGLRTDMSDCATITVRGLPPDLEIRYKTSEPSEPRSTSTTNLVTCHVIADNSDQSALLARRRAVDVIFDRLEDACPMLFQPRRLNTVHDGDSWRRIYANTDITAWISHGSVKFFDPIRALHGATSIGRESDWAKGPLHLDCGRHDGVYYAHVVDRDAGHE